VTDVYSRWRKRKAIKNKAQIWTFSALKEIRVRLFFPMKGIDSDNGNDFINAHLLNYCKKEHITFTRARPYRKIVMFRRTEELFYCEKSCRIPEI
jgi:hypothetical protein